MTPEHEAWRKALANFHVKICSDLTNRESFLAGMEAEHEVARLMGKLETVALCKDEKELACKHRWQAQLAALLNHEEKT